MLLGAAGARAADPEIVDAAYLEAALARGAIVWDTREAADYAKGHIPGAVSIGNVGRALRDDNREDYIPTPQIEALLGAAGIDPAREVVAYGTMGDAYAYFALVTLRHFGAGNARVFHGGIDEWVRQGKALTTEPSRPTPIKLSLQEAAGVTVGTEAVMSRLGAPGVQILDARSPAEYSGDDIRALRGGHIPGARNIPFEQNWQDPDTGKKLAARKVQDRAGMALKPESDLKALYADLDPTKETIVYCQSGVRAAQTATVLRQLGFQDVKVYDPSWLGYGNTLEAPAEDVTFVNVGLLVGRMGQLQARVDALEQALTALMNAARR